MQIAWGQFRGRGLNRTRRVEARPLDDGNWALVEKVKTGRVATEQTTVSQSFVPDCEFRAAFVPDDTTAKEMMSAAQRSVPA